MSKNELTTFTFNTANIRVVTIDGNPWFVAADVCRALDIHVMPSGSVNTTDALKKLDASEVAFDLIEVNAVGGSTRRQQVKIISESGLYKLVMRSDKPEAKAFQDWVTKVVLPAIRKDGAYVMGEEKVVTGEMSEDELVLKAVSILQSKVQRLAEEKALAAPGFNR